MVYCSPSPQLLLMRHFCRPLTVFWQDGGLNKKQCTYIVNALSEGHTTELQVALSSHSSPLDDQDNVEELVQAIYEARDLFHDIKCNVSYGFLVLSEVQAYLKTLMSDGYKEIKAPFATLAGLVGDGKSKEIYMKLASRVKSVALFFLGGDSLIRSSQIAQAYSIAGTLRTPTTHGSKHT